MKIENPEFLRRVENLEKLLDYNFKDKSLLLAAITHRSFVAEYPVKLKDYEVLEFLGDSVLSLIVSEILIKQFPDAREGDLSQLRSAIVSEAYLSKLAKLLNLGQFVLISKGEKSQKGSERDSLLCDVFEAVFGAIYIDTDYNIDTPRNVFNKLFKEKLLQDIKTENIPRDYKSLLQIETQKLYGKIPKYRLIHSEGPEHDKIFVVECEIEKIKTTGKGKSKKEAETQAAKEAFRKIKE
ncbi:ribonuclease III [Sulfurihydrogenibium azorense]|uniref:ribonuclease III n=1 Tax=Sulfurihydrogenibium azorense TaxID=309806 RepID=UPI002408FE30|nr:ribonuclease III [Sulfurihydrogenibium azorense]MDM7273986.1 ribonuclease III [Sulfurihydrogenibium azorense]